MKLENQLCFPLYAAARSVTGLYTPWLKQLGLTYTQYITMLVLWEHEKLTVKELGAELYLDSGTLTPLLKKLEEKGLVTRCRSTRDERNLILTITEDGEDRMVMTPWSSSPMPFGQEILLIFDPPDLP